jgi:hypothetical protein
VACFRKAIFQVHPDPSVTCVGLPSQTRATPEVSKGLETAAQVTEALDKGIVKIHNWVPGEDDSRFDILPYDVCVRASMLQDFFKVTPKDVIGNSNCDTQFCEFIMSGGLRGLGIGANPPSTALDLFCATGGIRVSLPDLSSAQLHAPLVQKRLPDGSLCLSYCRNEVLPMSLGHGRFDMGQSFGKGDGRL